MSHDHEKANRFEQYIDPSPIEALERTLTSSPYHLEANRLDDPILDPYDGSEVGFVVFDTGIDPIWAQREQQLIEDSFSVVPGENSDGHSHGTHVSSLIGNGQFGIVPKARRSHVKIMTNQGQGNTEMTYQGLKRILDNPSRGFVVFNFSIGGTYGDPRLQELFQECRNQGKIPFCANGNGYQDGQDYPARFENTVGVSALNPDFTLADFSDIGLTDTSGLGVNIYGAVLGGRTGRKSGTSQSTPIEAGKCAKAIDAEIKILGRRLTKTDEDFRQLVATHGVDLGRSGKDEIHGYGTLHLPNYVKWLKQQKAEDPDPEPSKDQIVVNIAEYDTIVFKKARR